MKILVALLLTVALVCAPYTVELSVEAKGALPWKTFASTVANVVNVAPGGCAGEQILRVHLEYEGRTFMYFAAENGRYLFVELDKNDKPLYVWLGEQLPSPDHDKIVVKDEHAYDPNRDGSGPCAHLFPSRT